MEVKVVGEQLPEGEQITLSLGEGLQVAFVATPTQVWIAVKSPYMKEQPWVKIIFPTIEGVAAQGTIPLFTAEALAALKGLKHD